VRLDCVGCDASCWQLEGGVGRQCVVQTQLHTEEQQGSGCGVPLVRHPVAIPLELPAQLNCAAEPSVQSKGALALRGDHVNDLWHLDCT
jgi:hypothetical protein